MSAGRWKRRRKRLAAAVLVGLAVAAWGIMLVDLKMGEPLRRSSYDLPFLFVKRPAPESVVLVRLDEASHDELGQPLALPWDRRLHARLIENLAAAGARLIVFDILFHDPNPEQDEPFAAAMRQHGGVILAGEIVRHDPRGDLKQSLLLASPALRRAAAGWGLTEVPIDSDGVVRRIVQVIPTDLGDKPALSEFVRQKITGEKSGSAGEAELLDYYGPAGTFAGHSYGAVVMNRGIPADAFRDKIVIVGLGQRSGLSDAGKDFYPTPYFPVIIEDPVTKEKSRRLTSGMEIQATAIANQLEGRRINVPGPGWNLGLVIGAGLLFAASACLLSPGRGLLLSIGLAAVIAALAIFLRLDQGLQLLWAIPVFGQWPLAAGLALGGHYFLEYSARWKLRRAFKSYMSDEQARQIDEDEVSLELGGREVEATILFSDLEGFTSMSEGLPPQAVSKALISYFERATEGILDNNGTIIKYVGDAVMATWGAPLKVDREADRAIDAAIQMQLASRLPITLEIGNGEVIAKVLTTRIGINSGLALAGNLGSKRRFDYSVIGDNTNLAARLEGLNKMLGTSILVAESVLRKCADPARFLTRRMGSYVVKGRRQGVVVHEVMGYADRPEGAIRDRSKEYLENYASGLEAFVAADFRRAAEFLSLAAAGHDRLAEDPASRLIMKSIAALEGIPLPGEWKGEIVLDSK